MPQLLSPLPNIRPITDMRTKLNEVCKLASETAEPVILTKNGVPAYVLQDSEAYEASLQQQRTYLALREAEIEEKYRPESISEEESNEQMRKIFDLWGLQYA